MSHEAQPITNKKLYSSITRMPCRTATSGLQNSTDIFSRSSASGVGIRTKFLALSDRRPSRGPKFLACPTESRAEPNCPIVRKSLGSAPEHFFGQIRTSDSRAPETFGALWRYICFILFLNDYFSRTNDNVNVFYCLGRLSPAENCFVYFIVKETIKKQLRLFH